MIARIWIIVLVLFACVSSHAQTKIEARLEREYQASRKIDVREVKKLYEVTSSSGFDGKEITCVLYQETGGAWWIRVVEKDRENLLFRTTLAQVKQKIVDGIDLSSHPSPLPPNSMTPKGKSSYRYYIASNDGEGGKWTHVRNPHPVIRDLPSGKKSLMAYFRGVFIEHEKMDLRTN